MLCRNIGFGTQSSAVSFCGTRIAGVLGAVPSTQGTAALPKSGGSCYDHIGSALHTGAPRSFASGPEVDLGSAAFDVSRAPVSASSPADEAVGAAPADLLGSLQPLQAEAVVQAVEQAALDGAMEGTWIINWGFQRLITDVHVVTATPWCGCELHRDALAAAMILNAT